MTTPDELKRALRPPSAPLDPAHRERLEQQVLEAFDRRGGEAPVARARPRWPRFAVIAATLLCLLSASQAPAEVQLEVGRRVTVELEGAPPDLHALGQAVAAALSPAAPAEVGIQVRRRAGGPARLIVDVWGPPLLDDAAARERLRPLVGQARVELTSLKGRVRSSLLDKLTHKLLRRRASPEELKAARRELLETLRRQEGEGAEIDVDVEQREDGQRFRVKVKRQAEQ